jgi:uncharacterized protein (TIGR03382 family)
MNLQTVLLTLILGTISIAPANAGDNIPFCKPTPAPICTPAPNCNPVPNCNPTPKPGTPTTPNCVPEPATLSLALLGLLPLARRRK